MEFQAMQQRLIEVVRERVANGLVTESQLARLTGFSQPHIHNVLKGVKVLKTELADEILRQMRISVEDLLHAGAARADSCLSVPLLTGMLGPGMAEFWPQRTHCCSLIPEQIAAQTESPLMIRLGSDPAMVPDFRTGDLILVDLAPESGRALDREQTCVVMTDAGPRLRYVFLTRSRVYWSVAHGVNNPSTWDSVERSATSSIIRAKVVWLTRQILPDYAD